MAVSSVIAGLRDALSMGRAGGERAVGRSLETTLGPLRCGVVHEVLGGIEGEGAGRKRVPDEWSAAVCVLCEVARAVMAEPDRAWQVVWIGRACWPAPVCLAGACADGGESAARAEQWPLGKAKAGSVRSVGKRVRGVREGLLGASVWVDPPDEASRLWCIDVACRCEHPTLVIADGRGLKLAQTRRLQLAAGVGAGVCVLGRPGREKGELSAATTRWAVSRTVSSTERPRWNVTLLRNKDQPALTERQRVWTVEWDDATGGIGVAADVGGGASASVSASGAGRLVGVA